MNSYWDIYGRLHHKPCINGAPSSNNGWIYTAYADKLMTIDLDRNSLTECFNKCIIKDAINNRSFLIRSPNKDLPPISRDEILGMSALGFLKPEHLNGWNFSPYPLPKFNLFKTISQFIELIGKDRNYLWQKYMDHTFRFAFSVPLSDRHFILSKWGKFNLFYWAIAKLDSVIGSPKNGIPWLKYDKNIEAMQEEFPQDHPLRLLK
jgi:hypothetical protein